MTARLFARPLPIGQDPLHGRLFPEVDCMDAMIRLQNIVKRYRNAGYFTRVLDDFDLEVPAGEFLAVMGPSGTGKTTLLNLIGGLDRPDAGSVTVAGARLDELDRSALARWRASHMGFVFQSHYLMPMLTATGNVELPLLLTRLSQAERRERAAHALARVGLVDRSGHRPSQLSGGQQQRVGIARAIVSGAPVLLCDEPTAGLDRAAADSILGLLAGLGAEGHTIVMVTHDPQAAAFAQRCVELAAVA
jgi:putative ABC transport system ATP-binding protein